MVIAKRMAAKNEFLNTRPHLRALAAWLGLLLVAAGAYVATAATDEAKVPWDFSDPRRPFATSCFDRFADEAADLTSDEAARWLAPVEGRPLEIAAPKSRHESGIMLKGIARLRAPWPPDAVLRLLVHNTTSLTLYFWMGEEGIRLQYYGDSRSRQMWVAYRITRPPTGQIVLDQRLHRSLDPGLAMLTTDSRRNVRAATGVHEIRYQDGTLVLGQGDLRLLTVPIAGPPTEVYFEGDGAIVKRIAMQRGEPMPPEPQRQRRVVMRGDRPSELRWVAELPTGARLERCADGAIRLAARETAKPALAAVPLVRPGLYEIIVAVDDPLPDTGLYLADADGRMLDAVGFIRDIRTSQSVLGNDQPEASPSTVSLDIKKAPAPYVSGRVWLRLVLAGGRLRCWSSGDGVHWGEVLNPHPAGGAVERIGLYSKATALPRSITLCQLRIQELDALASVAPLHLRQRALTIGLPPSKVALADVGAWEQWVWEHRPPGCDPVAWRRACGLALLLSKQDGAIVNAAFDGLLRESLDAPAPIDRKLAVLEDAALVCGLYSSTDCQRFAERFYDVGHQLLRKGDFAGFDSLRHTFMRLPRFSYGGRIEALDRMLLQYALEARATNCCWEDAARLCRQIRFWAEQPVSKRRWSSGQASLRGLVDWTEATAAARLPQLDQEDGLAFDPRWRHPIIVDVNKDAQNALLEMQLALRDQDWRTACQVLHGSTAPPWGLVDDQDDEQRLASYSTILSETMQQNPSLQRTMNEAVGEVELMRLRRAQAAGDINAVENAAIQFLGTGVGAGALVWLGDQQLTLGDFTRAIFYYDRAIVLASPETRSQLDARLRLASAMLGKSRGEPVTEPVRFGQTELSPTEFEGLVAEMLAAHQSPNGRPTSSPMKSSVELPAPARLAIRSWGQVDGSPGTRFQNVPSGSRYVDWSGRQHVVVATEDGLIVSNRFHMTAFNLQPGHRRWTHDLDEQEGDTHAWPLAPMRPVVAGGRVYTRLLTKARHPELMCLDLETGYHVWTSPYPGAVASDPVLAHDRLMALCEPSSPDGPVGRLTLTSFHLSTGAILEEVPLVTIGPQWHGRRMCQATLAADRIVAVVAGAVICCDTAGQLHWIRRNAWIPMPLDPYWGRQLVEPPLVVNDRVVATQPGTKTIDCLDLATGRLLWRLARPTVRRLLGTIDHRLVVQTDEGIAAVSLDSGQEVWHRRIVEPPEGVLAGAAGRLLYARRLEGAQVPYATLEWLDGRTGRLLGRQPFWTPSPKYVLVGPLASDGKRLWSLTAVADEQGKLTPRRELVELVSKGPLPTAPESYEGWNPNVPPAIRAGAQIVLPSWTLLSAREDKNTGLQAELSGRANVLVTRADTTPIRLVRHLHVPDEGKPQLVLDFGHDPHSQSRIEVRAAGLPVWQHFTPSPVDPKTTPDPRPTWTRQTIDLSDYAGKDVCITVVATALGGGPAYTWWQYIDLKH